MTKKDKLILEDILFRINQVEKFIKKDYTQVVVRDSTINKEIGSDLCYLYSAKERLENFLKDQS